jgi:uncharacterized protein (DUF302 family)
MAEKAQHCSIWASKDGLQGDDSQQLCWLTNCTGTIEELQRMTTESTVITYHIDHPMDAALRTVKRAFARSGIRVSAEVDVAAQLKRDLGAGVAPCVLLMADDPVLLLEAVVFYRGASLFIPQPVVVCGHGSRTEVMVRSSDTLTTNGNAASVRGPLHQLYRKIHQAIEGVAEREYAPLVASP